MTEKNLPLSGSELLSLAKRVGTPFNLYDGDAIEKNAEEMKEAFSWAPEFTNYFAVKALPNINILKLLGKHGFGADCSSLPELYMAKAAGIEGKNIMFTSNDTPDEEF
ncbi:MAG: diaminopimelate decarboxylase, partial [Spirochaetales bacterium]|nr:diaminopimelate decarboxylase [Spirochaetales bacterium]